MEGWEGTKAGQLTKAGFRSTQTPGITVQTKQAQLNTSRSMSESKFGDKLPLK